MPGPLSRAAAGFRGLWQFPSAWWDAVEEREKKLDGSRGDTVKPVGSMPPLNGGGAFPSSRDVVWPSTRGDYRSWSTSMMMTSTFMATATAGFTWPPIEDPADLRGSREAVPAPAPEPEPSKPMKLRRSRFIES